MIMAKIYNSAIIERITKLIRLMTSADVVPSELAEKVLPVLEVSPEKIVNHGGSSNKIVTGLSTLFTTPTDRDFFLTSYSLLNQSDVSADNILVTYQVTLASGEQINLIELAKITLTVYQESVTKALNFPIKLKRGSNIVFGSTFTVGVSKTSSSFTGYTVED